MTFFFLFCVCNKNGAPGIDFPKHKVNFSFLEICLLRLNVFSDLFEPSISGIVSTFGPGCVCVLGINVLVSLLLTTVVPFDKSQIAITLTISWLLVRNRSEYSQSIRGSKDSARKVFHFIPQHYRLL